MPEENDVAKDVRNALQLIRKLDVSTKGASEGKAKVETAFIRAIVRLGVHSLDSYNFHHMNEEISAGNLNPEFIPQLRNASITISAVAWPKSLEALASSLWKDVAQLREALLKNDHQAATGFSHEIHEKEHDLSHLATEWLSEES